MSEKRYSELKYDGQVYTEQWKIDEILIKNKFNWMVNAEIKNARLEIFQDTLVWNAGIWYNGDWYFGVWRDGEWRYGTWQNGVWYNGVWRNGTFKSGIIYKGKFFKGKIEKGEIRGGQFIDCEIAPGVVEYTGDEYQAKQQEQQAKEVVAQPQEQPAQTGQVKVHSSPPASQQPVQQPKVQTESKNNDYKMKKIKTFEEFDPKLKATVDMTRSLFKNKTMRKITKTLSLIDDIVHLDIRNFRNSLKNKEGLDKACDLFSELALALRVYLHSGDISDEEIFMDMEDYGFDIDKIIELLEDPQVVAYLEKDKRGKRRMDEKFSNLITFLRKYQMWKKGKNLSI